MNKLNRLFKMVVIPTIVEPRQTNCYILCVNAYLVPNRWNQTRCLVPSIEKRGDLPLGSQRALLHLPEVAKKPIISCLILYRNEFQHWFTSQGCLVFSTAR